MTGAVQQHVAVGGRFLNFGARHGGAIDVHTCQRDESRCTFEKLSFYITRTVTETRRGAAVRSSVSVPTFCVMPYQKAP